MPTEQAAEGSELITRREALRTSLAAAGTAAVAVTAAEPDKPLL